MLKRISTLLLILFVGLGISNAQVTDSTFNPALAQTLSALLGNTSNGFKGLSAAVDLPGQGRWIGTYGTSQGGAPITPDMRFCIASNSKTFVSGLCLKLQDEGLLHLDDSIGTYLPAYQHVNPDITIRQLLSHQSGLFDFYNDASNATLNAFDNNLDSLWTPEAVLATIGQPHFSPGTGYSYSNTNFLLASMVCEAAADTSFNFLLHNRILEPLGLMKTAYPAGGDSIFSEPWAMLFQGNTPELDPLHANGFNSVIQAAGGIWSTANDMVSWFRQLFDSNYLSANAQNELRDVEPWSSYSLGMRAKNTGGATLHYHSGAWGYRSMTMYDVHTGIVVSVLSNLQGKSVSDLADDLMSVAINSLPKKDMDIAISSVEDPNGTTCELDALTIFVKNTGLLPIENLTLQTWLNSVPLPAVNHPLSPSLMPDEERSLSQQVAITAGEEVQTLRVTASVINDGYDFNDSKTVQFQSAPLPLNPTAAFHETFTFSGSDLPERWISMQPENVQDWHISPFAGDGGALCRNNYNDANLDAEYLLDLPLFNLAASGEQPRLLFNYAYAPYPGFEEDSLEVLYSTDCGQNFQSLWKKGGFTLQTATETTASFLPGDNDWNLAIVDDFVNLTGQEVIRFRVLNRFGNNIWLDNVRLDVETAVQESRAELMRISPNPFIDKAILEFGHPLRNAQLTLTDLMGKTLWQQTGISGNAIELTAQDIAAGTYFLTLQEESGRVESVRFWVLK